MARRRGRPVGPAGAWLPPPFPSRPARPASPGAIPYRTEQTHATASEVESDSAFGAAGRQRNSSSHESGHLPLLTSARDTCLDLQCGGPVAGNQLVHGCTRSASPLPRGSDAPSGQIGTGGLMR